MPTVQLSYIGMFREVCEQLQIERPQHVITVDTDGIFQGYMDLPIARGDSVTEVVRCWGAQSPTSAGAEQEVARATLKRLVTEMDLHVKDVNYDDNICHKTMYDNMSTAYASICAQYSKLAQEQGFLKDCLISNINQKNELVTERIKVSEAHQDLQAVISRAGAIPPLTETLPSESMSAALGLL